MFLLNTFGAKFLQIRSAILTSGEVTGLFFRSAVSSLSTNLHPFCTSFYRKRLKNLVAIDFPSSCTQDKILWVNLRTIITENDAPVTSLIFCVYNFCASAVNRFLPVLSRSFPLTPHLSVSFFGIFLVVSRNGKKNLLKIYLMFQNILDTACWKNLSQFGFCLDFRLK